MANSCNNISCFRHRESTDAIFFALAEYELENTSVAWNSVTITDFNKLLLMQRQFAVLCHIDFSYLYDTLGMLIFSDRLCGLVVRVPDHGTAMYFVCYEVQTEFMYVM
jgi:hypothetical protein